MGIEAEQVEEWVREHSDYLYGYALQRLSGDSDLAKDLIQDTLFSAYKARQQFSGRSSVRTWLVNILKNKIVDHIRGQIRTRQMHEEIQTDPTSRWFGEDGKWNKAPQSWKANPESLCEDEDFRKVLQKCMSNLPDIQREVFVLRELNGDDTASICNTLNISSSNSHVLMHRARMALRSCLQFHWFGGQH